MSTTVSRCLKKGIHFLEAARVPEATISAEELLSYVLDRPRFSIYLDYEIEINRQIESEYETLLAKRAGRYPLQYLMRAVQFRHAILEIGEGCLIPRPETEVLAEVVLNCLGVKPLHLLDVGTGSGNIAISLAQERSEWLVTATDISTEALRYAKMNAIRNDVSDRVHFIETDLWHGVNGLVDAIVSNPPYLTDPEFDHLQPEIAFEPRIALHGGTDGFLFYQRMAREAKSILKPDGFIFFEIGAGQANKISHILETNDFCDVQISKDNCGEERIITAQLVNHGSR